MYDEVLKYRGELPESELLKSRQHNVVTFVGQVSQQKKKKVSAKNTQDVQTWL